MRTVADSQFPILRRCADMRRACTRALFLFVLAAAAGLSARAQQDVGYIQGTVTDQTGAALAGAKVTITWQSTGLKQDMTTNETGFYTSQPLQVGQYTVTVGLNGFAPAAIHNLTVDAAAHVEANMTLHVGASSSNVTVEGTPPVMDTTDAEVGNTIDRRDAQQLPVNGRSVLALATLSPGVVSAVGAVSEGFQNRGTAVSAIRIDGGAAGVNDSILDGVSNMQDWLGEVAINLKSDAVQEYRIMSGVIPAQFGYTSGGVIDMVTRSGTDQAPWQRVRVLPQRRAGRRAGVPATGFRQAGDALQQLRRHAGRPDSAAKAVSLRQLRGLSVQERAADLFQPADRAGIRRRLQRSGPDCEWSLHAPINIYDDDNIVGGQRQQFMLQRRGECDSANAARFGRHGVFEDVLSHAEQHCRRPITLARTRTTTSMRCRCLRASGRALCAETRR